MKTITIPFTLPLLPEYDCTDTRWREEFFANNADQIVIRSGPLFWIKRKVVGGWELHPRYFSRYGQEEMDAPVTARLLKDAVSAAVEYTNNWLKHSLRYRFEA